MKGGCSSSSSFMSSFCAAVNRAKEPATAWRSMLCPAPLYANLSLPRSALRQAGGNFKQSGLRSSLDASMVIDLSRAFIRCGIYQRRSLKRDAGKMRANRYGIATDTSDT